MINNNDYLLCAIRDKKTKLLGNVFMARNQVELERDLYRVVHSDQSPYRGFENEYEVCCLGSYNLFDGISFESDNKIIVIKNLIDIKNLNMNDKESLVNV